MGYLSKYSGREVELILDNAIFDAPDDGKAYIRKNQDWEIFENLDNIYSEELALETYSLEGGNTEAYSMSADGILSVNPYKLSDKQNFATIKAAVTQYENGSFVTENVTKKIEIWNRPAQVGDVVYYDGSYGSAEEYDEGGKTAIGVCCYVAPRKSDGSIDEKYHDPYDIQTRIAVSVTQIMSSVIKPGAYQTWITRIPSLFGTDSESYAVFYYEIQSDGSSVPKFFSKPNNQNSHLSDVPDIPGIGNSNSGMIDADGNVTNLLTDISFRDLSDEGLKNGGFKLFQENKAAYDGFSYNGSLNRRNLCTLSSETSDLTPSYKQGDVVNKGYANTLKTIAWRNSILKKGLPEVGIKPDTAHFHIPSGDDELEELEQCLVNLKNYAMDVLNDNTYPENWGGWYFPATSVAYAYEPKFLKNNEFLSNKFKKHNWFLPAMGMLARIHWYLAKDDSNFKTAKEKKVLLKYDQVTLSSTPNWTNGQWAMYNYSDLRMWTSYSVGAEACVLPVVSF